MRCTDAIMALPGLLMAMAVVGVLGHSVTHAMIGLSVAFMPGFARLVRGQVLAVKGESFVEAARVIGASPPRIIRKHILPNIASPLIVQAFVSVGFALLAEGALAYIGLSVQPGEASLGSLLQQGFNLINQTPRLMLVPGVVIVLLSLSFNAVADGIRDALANKERVADVGAQA
ncbi:MAG: oligopeptide transporter permease protein, partial [Ilumatobacteraceae bacterium]|nr:oligopeptide transporter permease protein [Ilumatobacteraceae bacterium]